MCVFCFYMPCISYAHFCYPWLMAPAFLRDSFLFLCWCSQGTGSVAFFFLECFFRLWSGALIACLPLRRFVLLVCTCFFAGDLQRGEQGRGGQGAAPWGVRGRLCGPHLGCGCVIPLPLLLPLLPLLLPLLQFLLRFVFLLLLCTVTYVDCKCSKQPL